MKEGIELISAERQRQLDVEKWTPEHDDEHQNGELALAAACYALPPEKRQEAADKKNTRGVYTVLTRFWPWPMQWWKPTRASVGRDDIETEVALITSRIRDLEKAGALVAAEIDRLCRVRVGTILERSMDPGGRR